MRPLLATLCILSLSSCIHLFKTRIGYASKSPPPVAGGAQFRAEFLPTQESAGIVLSAMVLGGATITEYGPYQMRLHAFGTVGDQRWFQIKRLHLNSTNHFEAPMEARGFEGRAEFKPTKTAGLTRASLLLGPYVHLDEKAQRDIVLEAEVEVMNHAGLTHGTFRIPLSLNKTRRRESTFICAEMWRDFRNRNSPVPPAALPPPPETAD